jgi:hypothetical protein
VAIPEISAAGTLHLRVERVDRADAAAEIVASAHISLCAGEARIFPFELLVRAPHPRSRYTVRAHLAATDREGVQVGDYVSTISYPVLSRGRGTHVKIALDLAG